MQEAAELASASIVVMRSIDHLWASHALSSASATSPGCAATSTAPSACTPTRSVTCGRSSARPEIARCLSGLGQVALRLGDVDAAREHLAESLRLCRDIGTHIGMARGIESCAALAVSEDDAERAVMLAAAATALRATTGLPPVPRPRTDRYLAVARRLDDGAIALLWARGLALSPEAAIELALGQYPRAPGPRERPSGGNVTPQGGLTPRELEIAALIAAGRRNKAIAAELVISPATVARHIANIMSKLGFQSRAQIAAWITDRR